MNNQEAIKAMHNLNMVLSITPSEREAVNMAIAALEEQQSRREWYQKGYADGKKDAENDRWVPVEERLPEVPKENPVFDGKELELYLVTSRGGGYPFRAFWNGKEFTDGWMKCDVTAWQPLPEPYRPEEEGEKCDAECIYNCGNECPAASGCAGHEEVREE